MKGKTKSLTQKVRDALLVLSDSILMETITFPRNWWKAEKYEAIMKRDVVLVERWTCVFVINTQVQKTRSHH